MLPTKLSQCITDCTWSHESERWNLNFFPAFFFSCDAVRVFFQMWYVMLTVHAFFYPLSRYKRHLWTVLLVSNWYFCFNYLHLWSVVYPRWGGAPPLFTKCRSAFAGHAKASGSLTYAVSATPSSGRLESRFGKPPWLIVFIYIAVTMRGIILQLDMYLLNGRNTHT